MHQPVATGSPVSLANRSARGARNACVPHGTRPPRALKPMLTLSRSSPNSRISLPISMESTSAWPSRELYSTTPKRAVSGRCSGQTLRTAANVSRQEACSVLRTATVAILPLVAVGAEEALRQIAMSEVKLQPFKSCSKRTLGCSDEIRLNAMNVLNRHLVGNSIERAAKGDRRGTKDRPSCGIIGCDVVIALPWPICTSLAPCVADLDASYGTALLDGRSDGCHSWNLLITPQASTSRGDASFRRHGGSLDNHEPSASARKRGIVAEMPIVDTAVLRTVLAHGRHRDTILKSDTFELEWAKQGRHKRGFGESKRSKHGDLLRLRTLTWRLELLPPGRPANPGDH